MSPPRSGKYERNTVIFKFSISREVKKTMRKIKYIISSCMVFAFVSCFLNLGAQTTTSTIEGTVTDPNGAVIAGANVTAAGATLATERSTVTDNDGHYRLSALPAGSYTVTISQKGFTAGTYKVELTLNRVTTFDGQLKVGGDVGAQVTVTSELPLLEPNASSTGATITPEVIQSYPVNGRQYLDLLQLVPGVAVNRQANPNSDNSTPVLGERSGNNNFFIDGQPNKDTVNGGAAAQFNQETIAEFQVLTSAYKAEFGQASGAIVNVITKSGGNQFHGVGSFFHRNDAFDSSNALDPTVTDAPFLHRYDYSLAGGGPIVKDRVFFFGSSERIQEDRGLTFKYPVIPTVLLQLLHSQEDPLDDLQASRGTRNFFKLNEQLGRHQLSEEINYTNEFVRGSGNGLLPSARTSTSARHLMLGFGDTILLGDKSNPWIVTARGAYRGEPSDSQPAHPLFNVGTALNAFPAVVPCPSVPPTPPINGCVTLFSTLPTVTFGNATGYQQLDQQYTSLSVNADKLFGRQEFKFGWQFLRTHVDGIDPKVFTDQLFATVNDYATLGPINSGVFLLLAAGGNTPAATQIHLRNNYNAVFLQDDVKVTKNLTLNFGGRWDSDSAFPAKRNLSPRLGLAWSVTPKTVIRTNYGVFYDQFRLGLVSQVPAFGGADRRVLQSLYFPRGFYGSPSAVEMLAFLSGLPGPCISNTLTDAQITAAGTGCPLGGPIVGVDRLNNVVAPGHAPIPANAVINISNVQMLTGLTPAQYLTQAAAAIGQPNGYFEWGQFGVLDNPIIPPQIAPTTVDSNFKTPHTIAFSAGVQREITKDIVFAADYYHREMHDLLGTRLSNLAFKSRVTGRSFDPPNTTGEIHTFGPYFHGKYDGLVLSLNKRLSHRYLIGANYTFANETDNSLGIFTLPTDNFIGIAPLVTDPGRAATSTAPACPSQNNQSGSFISCRGNFVAKAGTFVNGPDLDKGPSDLSLKHIFQVNGLVNLPWKFQVSGIFRVQSGFHFSQFDAASRDPDGNGNFNSIDFTAGRNAFTAPSYVNLDMRFAKRFDVTERVKIDVLFEFFNLLNSQNPASVFNRHDQPGSPFGTAAQVLPGREGQIGFRVSF
jgi:hypothetical protein